jgi:hypothetical protein
MDYFNFLQSPLFYVFLVLSILTQSAYALGYYGDGSKKKQLLRNSRIATWIVYILNFIFIGFYGGIGLIVLSFLVTRHISSLIAILFIKLLRKLV